MLFRATCFLPSANTLIKKTFCAVTGVAAVNIGAYGAYKAGCYIKNNNLLNSTPKEPKTAVYQAPVFEEKPAVEPGMFGKMWDSFKTVCCEKYSQYKSIIDPVAMTTLSMVCVAASAGCAYAGVDLARDVGKLTKMAINHIGNSNECCVIIRTSGLFMAFIPFGAIVCACAGIASLGLLGCAEFVFTYGESRVVITKMDQVWEKMTGNSFIDF